MTMLQWSKYQLDFYVDTAKGSGNTVVESCAGSGKSTSLAQALRHVPSGKETFVTSFSNACVDDLKAKISTDDDFNGPDIRTLNSHGFRACRDEFGSLEVDTDRIFLVLDKVLGELPKTATLTQREEFGAMRYRVKMAVDLGKTFLATTPEDIIRLADQFDIAQEVPRWAEDKLQDRFKGERPELFARMVLATMDACKKPTGRKIDFNDQLWLPVVLGLEFPKYDRLFIDEAQDLSPVQMEMVFRSAEKGARLCAIGDSNQAIYAWRGAGIGMEPFIKRAKARVLPLSISYRCPKNVVAEARQIVKSIEPSSTAPNGHVDRVLAETLPGRIRVGDVILSRKNAPLVRIFFDYLRRNIPVAIQGRDLGGTLKTMVGQSGAKSVGELREFAGKWEEEQIEIRRRKFPNGKVDAITDRAETARIICDMSVDLSDVHRHIDRLMGSTSQERRGFTRGRALGPDRSKITLSSVHRAKGLEWDRVFLIESSFKTSKYYWWKTSDPSTSEMKLARERAEEVIANDREEANIRYVAITRSKNELYYVTEW